MADLFQELSQVLVDPLVGRLAVDPLVDHLAVGRPVDRRFRRLVDPRAPRSDWISV